MHVLRQYQPRELTVGSIDRGRRFFSLCFRAMRILLGTTPFLEPCYAVDIVDVKALDFDIDDV